VHVDPIKPTMQAPGIKLLKLKYDKPLSNFAFKFNLRRYIMERSMHFLKIAVNEEDENKVLEARTLRREGF